MSRFSYLLDALPPVPDEEVQGLRRMTTTRLDTRSISPLHTGRVDAVLFDLGVSTPAWSNEGSQQWHH